MTTHAVEDMLYRHAYSRLDTSSRKKSVNRDKYMQVGAEGQSFLESIFALPKGC